MSFAAVANRFISGALAATTVPKIGLGKAWLTEHFSVSMTGSTIDAIDACSDLCSTTGAASVIGFSDNRPTSPPIPFAKGSIPLLTALSSAGLAVVCGLGGNGRKRVSEFARRVD